MSEMKKKKTCFVIAPIGDQDSETRRRSDKVLKHIIRPIAEKCGYDEIIRADEISETGIITTQVIKHIMEDDLVIADLTERNPNVFYELAIRHMMKKPFIQLTGSGEQIPFDVAQVRSIELDYQDLDSVDHCKKELIKHMEAIEKDPSNVDNPFSVAFTLPSIVENDKAEHPALAGIVLMLRGISNRLNRIENYVDPSSPLSNMPLDALKNYEPAPESAPLKALLDHLKNAPPSDRGKSPDLLKAMLEIYKDKDE